LTKIDKDGEGRDGGEGKGLKGGRKCIVMTRLIILPSRVLMSTRRKEEKLGKGDRPCKKISKGKKKSTK